MPSPDSCEPEDDDATLVAAGDAPRDDEEITVDPGHRMGRYVLLETLGSGGMGVVFRAYDPRLGREVALKRLRPRVIEQEGEVRLLREAQAMARLNHPNVVTVYDVERIDAAVVVAMEYIQGDTLETWLARDRTWLEILRAFRQAGRGLAAAHAAGLVHRDFKPSNVLIGKDGRARVVDFGLARGSEAGSERSLDGSSATVDPELEERTLSFPLTQAGTIMGTPRYMAPEQLGSLRADGRSDQYAFCVALWEALCGRAPFAGDLRDMARAKRRGPPAFPRRAGVPAWLEPVLTRGLSPIPDRRYGDMNALLAALGDGRRERARRRVWIAGVGGAVVLGTAGLVGFVTHRASLCSGAEQALSGVWDDARRTEVRDHLLAEHKAFADGTQLRVEVALDAYANDWIASHTAACEATTLRGEQSTAVMDRRMGCLQRRKLAMQAVLDVLLQGDNDLRARADEVVDHLPAVADCNDIERLLSEVPMPSDPAIAERAAALDDLWARIDALHVAARYEEARDLVRDELASVRQLGYPPALAEGLLRLGMLEMQVGNYEASERHLEEGYDIALRERMLDLGARTADGLLFLLGNRQGRFPEAEIWGRTALALAGEDRPIVRAEVLQNYAALQTELGDYELGRRYAELAVELLERAKGGDDPKVALALNQLGNQLHEQGDLDGAEAAHRRALAIRERTLGELHPHVATSCANLGLLALERDDYDRAEALQLRGLHIREQAFGPDHRAVGESLTNLAALYGATDREPEAEVAQRRALEIARTVAGPRSPGVALALNNLAALERRRGDVAAAERSAREALDIRETLFGPEHPVLAQSLNNLSAVLLDLDRAEEAEAALRRGIGILERVHGHKYGETINLLERLADLVSLRGGVEAETLALRAVDGATALHGERHLRTADALRRLGEVQRRLQRSLPAVETLQRALAIVLDLAAPASQAVPIQLELALAELDAGLFEAALQHVDAALRGATDVPLEDLANLRFARAKILWKQGQSAAALQEARQARADLSTVADRRGHNGRFVRRVQTELDAWLADARARAAK